MARISTEPAPDIVPHFHFYHADLGPTNIMVSEDGDHVTGIIDWESAAYYPRFWAATKPVTAGAFGLSARLTNRSCGVSSWDMHSRQTVIDGNWNNSIT